MKKKTREFIHSLIERSPLDTLTYPTGFEEAIIGVSEKSGRAIMSEKLCITILVKKEKMDEEDAIEHFYYNVKGSYIGKMTPIWKDKLN